MTVPLPDVDDRTYADLVDEARAMLPALDPGWTDHNPSDPGIALVELLAWLTEMLVFSAAQVPDERVLAFLSLLHEPRPDGSSPAWSTVAEGLAATRRSLHERYRAATCADYEQLVLLAWPLEAVAKAMPMGGLVRRAHCVPGRNLAAPDPAARAARAPAHVSVVVLPEPALPDPALPDGLAHHHPVPGAALLAGLAAFLQPRRLLGTRHHIVGPGYVDVTITATLALRADAPPDLAFDRAREALRLALSPITGGPHGTGRALGADVHVSELYAVLEALPLIDACEGVSVTGASPGVSVAEASPGASVRLEEHELARLTRVELVAYDTLAREHEHTWTASR